MMLIMYNVKRQQRHIGRWGVKVSREQAAQHRERILEAAAQRFRERGFEGIGVADLMKEAGLTHGGFYGHFSSKEDLIAEASARALAQSLARWGKLADRASDDPLSAVAGAYLSTRHRDNPGAGCVLAALGPDVSRQGPAVRRSVTGYVRSACDLLAKLIPGKSKAARRQKAISTFATLVGAMVIARAVDDRALSQEILDASLASVKGLTLKHASSSASG
jgi:TetR/AcrR family transcriptional regulator, transcriptional repressor for nem operon